LEKPPQVYLKADSVRPAGSAVTWMKTKPSAVCWGDWWIVIAGLALTLAQILFAYTQSGNISFTAAYLNLYQFDSYWYGEIAEVGYHNRAAQPTEEIYKGKNVAFFPCFPMLARFLLTVFGLPTKVAVLLAAQLACWGFWSYLFLLLRSWGMSILKTATVTVLLAAHPCAFYLIAGYSESLFLMSLLGFFYWSGREGSGSSWLAGAHGFVMTSTRLVGLPLVLIPLLLAMRSTKIERGKPNICGVRMETAIRSAMLTVVASLGALVFFGYCQLRFGFWNLYMRTQSDWGLKPDYLAIFRPKVYSVFLPREGVQGFVSTNDLSKLSVPLTLALLCFLLALETWTAWRRPDNGWRERLPFHFGAWSMFYISVCGLVAVEMHSMIRYTFPVHMLLALAAVHLLCQHPSRGFASDLGFGLLVIIIPHVAWLQSDLVYLFTSGHWVA